MNAKEVIDNLKLHYPSPQFAFLEQVADGTGARQFRWADAVAMSVWPSRGYDIHGIEVKVSKSDWKSELKNPEKSQAVQRYTDRWWIATPDESIIAAGELPPTWGWMVCKEKGGMRVVVDAPRLTPEPITVEFLASILRNIQKADENAMERERRKAWAKGQEEGTKHYRESYARVKKTLEEFEAASGIRLSEYTDGKELGEAVSTLHNLKYRVQHIGSAIKACEDVATMLKQVETLHSLIEAAKPQSATE